MSKKLYMLDTCICSFIMRENPITVLQKLQTVVEDNHQITISAITYSEMRFGSIGKKASAKHGILVEEFLQRVDTILPWDSHAVDATTKVKKQLSDQGTPIGANDSAIAGHAIATNAILVTNNIREFSRVDGLTYEDWVN